MAKFEQVKEHIYTLNQESLTEVIELVRSWFLSGNILNDELTKVTKGPPGNKNDDQPIYLSGIESSEDFSLLEKKNIKTVIYLGTINKSREIIEKYKEKGINHIQYSIKDDDMENLYDFLDEIFHLIEKSREEGGLLIHCGYGGSRSVCALAYYIMKKYNMPLKDTLIYLKNKRKHVSPNIGFVRQLYFKEMMNRLTIGQKG